MKEYTYKEAKNQYNWHYPHKIRSEIWIANPEGDIIGKATDERHAEEMCAALNAFYVR